MARNCENTKTDKQKRLKIGITCYPSVGGSGIIATELGLLLAEQGFEVHFITSSMPFRLSGESPSIFFHEVEVHNYPVFKHPPYDLALASKMAEVIDEQELDILHVHYAMPHAISAILAREIADRPIKIVTTLHGTDITVLGVDPTFKKMIKYGIDSSDAVTAVSRDLVEQTKEMLDVEKDIEVIYNFINEDDYYRKDNGDLREKLGLGPNENILIHISNFRKVKRINDIIDTFAKVHQNIQTKLILVGDGPLYSEMFDYVKSLGLEDDVLFLGNQKDISGLLSIADIMLLLSEKESFGLVLLEAMACKVPVIGTNVGGIPEVIDHGETGYVVPLGDVEQAAEYSIELLTNKVRYEKFKNAAFEKSRKVFDSQIIVKQYIDVYNRVLKQ